MGAAERKKWLFLLFSALLISFLIFLSAISGLSSASYAFTNNPVAAGRGLQYPPAFGYFIFGGGGDKERMFRLLLAIYHPRNRYLLHLAMDASREDREWLAAKVIAVPAMRQFGNVDIVGKPLWITYMGSTHLAATLRAASVLLKVDGGWDWFITLSALDYPLMTQDDLSHVFSSLRRELNFIDHTSDLDWKEYENSSRSPWVILSRPFLEFCVFGWDNLPRILLMYFNNMILPHESYFHSVICNSPEFRNTMVNNDLRYMIWDNPPRMEPQFLNSSDYDKMVNSGAAFARQFQKDDSMLTMVDEKILNRRHNRVAPGAWCTARDSWFSDGCSRWGDLNAVKPGPQAKKLAETMSSLLDDRISQTTQCT
ncbi:Beta-glucuronosyltransferase GlcAT14A-like protein [Drosera capensis]